jgi:hypothetical protein
MIMKQSFDSKAMIILMETAAGNSGFALCGLFASLENLS